MWFFQSKLPKGRAKNINCNESGNIQEIGDCYSKNKILKMFINNPVAPQIHL